MGDGNSEGVDVTEAMVERGANEMELCFNRPGGSKPYGWKDLARRILTAGLSEPQQRKCRDR